MHCKMLSFIEEHSMLRQKLCDAATDALRLKWLQAKGYRTSALELVEDAPKNILLRAVRNPHYDPQSSSSLRAMEEYKEARIFLCGSARLGLLEPPLTLFEDS